MYKKTPFSAYTYAALMQESDLILAKYVSQTFLYAFIA